MRKFCPPVKKASRNQFGCVTKAINPQIHSPPGMFCAGKRHFHSEELFASGLAPGSCTSCTVSYWTRNLLHKLTTEHVCTASVLYGAYGAAIDRNLKGPGHMPLRLAMPTRLGSPSSSQNALGKETNYQLVNTLFAFSRAFATHSKKNGI